MLQGCAGKYEVSNISVYMWLKWKFRVNRFCVNFGGDTCQEYHIGLTAAVYPTGLW